MTFKRKLKKTMFTDKIGKKSFSKVTKRKPSDAMRIRSKTIEIILIRISDNKLLIFIDQTALGKTWNLKITSDYAINSIGDFLNWKFNRSVIELEQSRANDLLREMFETKWKKRPEKEVFKVLESILQGCNKALLEDVFLSEFQRKEIDLLVDAIYASVFGDLGNIVDV